jgi:hypothetical protein
MLFNEWDPVKQKGLKGYGCFCVAGLFKVGHNFKKISIRVLVGKSLSQFALKALKHIIRKQNADRYLEFHNWETHVFDDFSIKN